LLLLGASVRRTILHGALATLLPIHPDAIPRLLLLPANGVTANN
jgi:hypothetical protein